MKKVHTAPHFAGAPVAPGPARTVQVRGSAPAPVHPAFAPVATHAARAGIASLPAPVLAHLSARADRLDAARGIAPSGTDLDRAARSVGRGDWTCDGAPATAARWTTAARDAGLSARWALDPSHTGAIPAARMRVRAKAPRPPVDGAPRPAPDALAGMAETGRRAACAKVRALVAAYQAGRKARRNVTHLVTAIRDILSTGDAAILDAARDAGWAC
jgi:hypothetical protein